MGVLTAFVVALEVLTAIYASKRKRVARALLWCAAAFVVVYEVVSFAKTRQMPIAFSTFSYFLFGIAVFLPWRPIKSAAAFCAFVSGVVYLSGFAFYPDTIYARQPFEVDRIVGFLLHNLMLFGALLLYGRLKVAKVDALYIVGFVAFITVYAEVAAHACASDQVNVLTQGAIEATLIREVIPSFELRWWWYVLWYALMAAVAWGTWELTGFVNRRLLRQ